MVEMCVISLNSGRRGSVVGSPGLARVFSALAVLVCLFLQACGSYSSKQTLSTLSIATTSLPAGTVGTAYSATLTGLGGTPPYTWLLTSGTLPAGFSLSAGGVIS